MKTTIYILTSLFVMNFTFLSAGNPKINILKANNKSDNIALSNSYLAPVTPKEAFFNDVEPTPLCEIARLAPITPKEATFEDIKAESNIQSINPFLLQKMAPVTPKEAEFEDDATEKITGIDPLAPSSPLAAAFEE
jgi:hypothetical protein